MCDSLVNVWHSNTVHQAPVTQHAPSSSSSPLPPRTPVRMRRGRWAAPGRSPWGALGARAPRWRPRRNGLLQRRRRRRGRPHLASTSGSGLLCWRQMYKGSTSRIRLCFQTKIFFGAGSRFFYTKFILSPIDTFISLYINLACMYVCMYVCLSVLIFLQNYERWTPQTIYILKGHGLRMVSVT